MARKKMIAVCVTAGVLVSVGGCGISNSKVKQMRTELTLVEQQRDDAREQLGEINDAWLSLSRKLLATEKAAEAQKTAMESRLKTALKQLKQAQKQLAAMTETAKKNESAWRKATQATIDLRKQAAGMEKFAKRKILTLEARITKLQAELTKLHSKAVKADNNP